MIPIRILAASSILLAACTASSALATTSIRPASSVTQDDEALTAAWDRYYQAVNRAKQAITESPQYAANPDQRAKAFQALLEAQAMAYNFALAPRTATPRMFRNTGWQTELYTLGGNGPDFDYRVAFLDGQRSYRITGNVRDSRMLLGQLMGSLPGTGGSRHTRNYDFSDFAVDADGSFEIIASAAKHKGNWIELDPASDFQWLLFRPTVDGPDARAAELSITPLDGVTTEQYAAREFSAVATARRIDQAAGFLTFLIDEWAIGYLAKTRDNAGGDNVFNVLPPADPTEVGSPTANYVMATFDLGEDEALVLELPHEPKGVYWSFQLFDVWLRSLDFRTRQSTLNGSQIRKDSDGKIRLVIAHSDPGYANWLDTTGLKRGQITFRDYRTNEPFSPNVRRVKFTDLARYIPTNAVRVTASERSTALAERAKGYRVRQGE